VRTELQLREYEKDAKVRAVVRVPRSREGLEVENLVIRKARR
jgi:hypothetical protein